MRKVKESYPAWEKAFGNMTWERYLERIIGLKETGDSAREAARQLLSQSTNNDTKGKNFERKEKSSGRSGKVDLKTEAQ